VKLHVKLLGFSWNFEFKILKGGSFPMILGLDFLAHTQMNIKVASRQFCFNFAPERNGTFGIGGGSPEEGQYLRSIWDEVAEITGPIDNWPSGVSRDSI
jgi:hypothetical protein